MARPSVLRDNQLFLPVRPIFVYGKAGEQTFLTGDYSEVDANLGDEINLIEPAPLPDHRQHSAIYLPHESVSGDFIPLWIDAAHSGVLDHPEDAARFLGRAFREQAHPGLVELLAKIPRPPVRYFNSRGGARSPGFLGYGWALPHYTDGWGFEERTIEAPDGGRREIIEWTKRGGAHIVRWRTQIDGESIDISWVNTPNWGRGFQTASFFVEDDGGPNELIHNPTQAGSVYSPAQFEGPPHSHVLPENLDKYSNSQASLGHAQWIEDGSRRILRSMARGCLDFRPDGRFGAPKDPLRDHGGEPDIPILYPSWECGFDVEFYWRGLPDTHLVTWIADPGFSWPLTEGLFSASEHGSHSGGVFHVVEVYDTIVAYDAATDTETDVTPTLPDHNDLDHHITTDFIDRDFIVIGPSPIPSGSGGLLLRDTGALYGLGTDFTIGWYGGIAKRLDYDGNWSRKQTSWGFDITKIDTRQGGIFGFNTSWVGMGGGGLAGFFNERVAMPNWLILGLYPDVKARMRQLYLEGYGRP